LAAYSESELIGWCNLVKLDSFYSSKIMLNVAIAPAFRGRGIGSNLVRTVLKRALLLDQVRLEIEVDARETRAVSFLRS
jgi:RimJ/RimL family protein N-acetyltransferase